LHDRMNEVGRSKVKTVSEAGQARKNKSKKARGWGGSRKGG